MQAYETTFEETADAHLSPTVIIGITDDKTREDEEKVNSYVSVVKRAYYSVSCAVCNLGKRESFKNMIKKYQYGCYTA